MGVAVEATPLTLRGDLDTDVLADPKTHSAGITCAAHRVPLSAGLVKHLGQWWTRVAR